MSTEPSWKKFENFEGPDEETRTQALRLKRERDGHGGNEFESLQSGGHWRADTPRHWKHNRKMRA